MPENLKGLVGPEQQFKNYLSEGKFMIQRCKSLDKFFFHPRVAFPGTGERDLEWVEASGIGTVHSTTCNRRLPEKGGDFNLSLMFCLASSPGSTATKTSTDFCSLCSSNSS